MATDPRLEDAFAAYRDVERPSERSLDDTWAALERRIAAGDTGPRLSEEAAPEDDGHAPARTVAIAAAVAAALGALWLVSPSATRLVAGDADEAPWVESEHQAVDGGEAQRAVPGQEQVPKQRPRRRVAPAEAVELPEPELVVDPEVEVEPEPEIPEVRSKVRSKARSKVRSKVRSESPKEPAGPALVEQARELQRIRTLVAGDPTAALRALKEHREQAPESPFAREREALMLLAECQLGHAERVRDRVDRVVDAQPGSPLAKRISEACGVED